MTKLHEVDAVWNYEAIFKEEMDATQEHYAGRPEAELLAVIAALRTQLYPLCVALCPVLEKSWRGTSASSKLFPMRPQNDEHKFLIFNPETNSHDEVSLTEAELSGSDYYTEDSLLIEDGENLSDRFELLSFHQQAPGAYVGNGSLTVGDVRLLSAVFLARGSEASVFDAILTEEKL